MTGLPRLRSRRSVLAVFAAVALSALSACATAPPAPSASGSAGCKWSYANPGGWWKICPQYAACGTGSRQSPIDVRGAIARTLPALEFSYGVRKVTVVDTGHDIQVNLPAGGSTSLTVGGRTYQLAQFHFHEPSEHKIDGKGAPMEIHFVHADQGGELTVAGVLLREGRAPNPAIATILAALNSPGKTAELDPADLLPADRSYFGYAGSLTTPPCTEGVRWHLLRGTIEVSKEQIAAFHKLHPGNARPIQDANGRVVLSKE